MDNTNNTADTIDKIIGVIQDNKSGMIVLPANPTVDAIAAATSLYLGIIKNGQDAGIACSTKPQSDLVAADKIQNSLTAGGDNLIVSFPYKEGSIDRVDYNIQGNFFNLVIVPRPGNPKLDPDSVSYTYSGGKAEYFITIDAPNLNSLGQIYTENQNQFQGRNIINIDRHLINNSFGTVNLVNKTSSSTSELILQVLEAMQVEIDKDIATNLYTGLLTATNNFTAYSVNPQTFEAASTLMRLGAQKKAQAPGAPGLGGQPPGLGGGKPFAPPAGGAGGFGGGMMGGGAGADMFGGNYGAGQGFGQPPQAPPMMQDPFAMPGSLPPAPPQPMQGGFPAQPPRNPNQFGNPGQNMPPQNQPPMPAPQPRQNQPKQNKQQQQKGRPQKNNQGSFQPKQQQPQQLNNQQQGGGDDQQRPEDWLKPKSLGNTNFG